jgi:hypothetical protein
VRIDPTRAAAYAVLARCYAAAEKWSELDSTLAIAAKKSPDDLLPYYRTAEALLESNRSLDRAAAYLQTYLRAEPKATNQPWRKRTRNSAKSARSWAAQARPPRNGAKPPNWTPPRKGHATNRGAGTRACRVETRLDPGCFSTRERNTARSRIQDKQTILPFWRNSVDTSLAVVILIAAAASAAAVVAVLRGRRRH